MSYFDDNEDRIIYGRGSNIRNGASSLSNDMPCQRYGALVYWGPGWLANGESQRKLFTTATKRPHDCSTQPDADAFDVVPE